MRPVAIRVYIGTLIKISMRNFDLNHQKAADSLPYFIVNLRTAVLMPL